MNQEHLDDLKKRFAYLYETPDVIRQIVSRRAETFAPFIEKTLPRTVNRVILLGVGSSYNACLAAKPLIEFVNGLEVTLATPPMLSNLSLLDGSPDILYVAASQSGRSASVVAAVRELTEMGRFVVGVTGDVASPLAKASSIAVGIGCGEEAAGPMTKGVTATAITIALMLTELAYRKGQGSEAAFVAKGIINETSYVRIGALFFQIADSLPLNFALTDELFAANTQEISAARGFHAIGSLDALGAGMEFCLKVMETSTLPASAFELEEYLHGPSALLAAEDILPIVLETRHFAEHERLLRVGRHLRSIGKAHLRVAQGNGEVTPNTLRLKSIQEAAFDPFELMPVLQLLSLRLCEHREESGENPAYVSALRALAAEVATKL